MPSRSSVLNQIATEIEKSITPPAPKQAELRFTAPTETMGGLVKAGSKLPQDTPDEVHLKSPTETLMKAITEPGPKGVPFHAPWFWRQTFAYLSQKTKKVFC